MLYEVITRGDYKSSALGAGFVVDADRGWVMTNAHVSARSPSQVRIAFRGGAYKAASKVYVDPYLDLAILQLSDEQREGKPVVTAGQILPPDREEIKDQREHHGDNGKVMPGQTDREESSNRRRYERDSNAKDESRPER